MKNVREASVTSYESNMCFNRMNLDCTLLVVAQTIIVNRRHFQTEMTSKIFFRDDQICGFDKLTDFY